MLDEKEVVVLLALALHPVLAFATCGCAGAAGDDDAAAVVLDVSARSTATYAAFDAPRAPTTASPRSSDPIPWTMDLEEAWARASKQGRPLLVYVRAAWNATSLEMEKSTLVSASVVRAAKAFVPVYVDITDDDVLARTETRVAVPLDLLPTIVLFDPRTERRAVLAGPRTEDRLVEGLADFVSAR